MNTTGKRLAGIALAVFALTVLILSECLIWDRLIVSYDCKYVEEVNGEIEERHALSASSFLSGITKQYLSLGGETSAVSAVEGNGYEFVGWSDGSKEPTRRDRTFAPVTYTAYFTFRYEGLPVIDCKGDTVIVRTEEAVSYEGTLAFESVHTGYPGYKFPAQILFQEETVILSLAPSRTLQLISLQRDPALLRDYFAYRLAEGRLPSQPRARLVSLIADDEYRGVYLLSEVMAYDDWLFESGRENAVGLLGLPEARYGAAWVNAEEEFGVVDHFYKMSPWQSAYIGQVIRYAGKAIFLNGSYERVAPLFDMDSMVNAYLLAEITKNTSMGVYGSILSYREGTITFEAMTYFSASCGLDRRDASPEGSVFAKKTMYGNAIQPLTDVQFFLFGLYSQEWFQVMAQSRWPEIREEIAPVLAEMESLASVLAHSGDKRLYPSFALDGGVRVEEWEHYLPGLSEYTYKQQADYLIDWIGRRVAFLDDFFEVQE